MGRHRRPVDQETILYAILIGFTVIAITAGIVNQLISGSKRQYRYVDEQSALYMMKYGDIECEYLPSDDDNTSNDWRCDW